MFEVCEICDVVVEKVFIEEEQETGCKFCWDAYGEIHQAIWRVAIVNVSGNPYTNNIKRKGN